MRAMIVGIVLGLLSTFIKPLALPVLAAAHPSWLGVTLEEPMADVRDRLGDPLKTFDAGDGTLIDRYLARNGRAHLIISHRGGRVVGIALREPAESGSPFTPPMSDIVTDPFGVKIGMSPRDLYLTRGKDGRGDRSQGELAVSYGDTSQPHSAYFFVGERLLRIDLIDDGPVFLGTRSLDPAPPLPVHDGSTLASAIVVKQPTDDLGTMFERLYRTLNLCSGEQPGRVASQGLSIVGEKKYDSVTVQCASGTTTKKIFDITASFGKL